MPAFRTFERTEVPPHHRSNASVAEAAWFTWSQKFLETLSQEAALLRALPAPLSVTVRGCEPYSRTYTYRISALPSRIASFAMNGAYSLLREPVDHRIRFFGGMLTPPVSSANLHRIFALFRCGITGLLGDAKAALHSPVRTSRVDRGFPLHADLFFVDRVWLVFDDVPRDASGRSLFLRRIDLERTLKETCVIPTRLLRHVKTLLRGGSDHDAFDELFDLLHSADHPWVRPLRHETRKFQWAVKLRRGEGYLIDDRNWLHGRTHCQQWSRTLSLPPVGLCLTVWSFRRLALGS